MKEQPVTELTAKPSTLSARVLKVLGIFSGVQMLTILCSIVKMKLVALWLGAGGVGLFGIYQSVIDTVATCTDMGLRQSAVREAASAQGTSRLALTVRLVRRWSLLAGLLGAVVMAALSVPLGIWFFGNVSGAWGFLWLGAAMLLNSLCGGEQALLQGTSHLKTLARANVWGALTGLAISVPCFYWLGEKGVVISIIAYALTLFAALMAGRVRAPQQQQAMGLGQLWHEGKGFVRLGVCMAIASFITALAHTLFVGILNEITSTATVGLVQGGDTLVVRYIGLIFVAIGVEFYPRMAAHSTHPRRMQTFVNHEVTLLLLLLTPLLLLFLLLRRPVVTLLYSSDFLQIIPFISWAAIGSIPKAVSWCMAYTILAKGDGRVYMLTEGLDALVSVPLCLLAYTRFGFTGLGVAYILWYIIYLLLVGTVYYRRYGLRLCGSGVRLSVAAFVTCILFVLAVDHLSLWFTVPAAIALTAAYAMPLKRLLRY